jgi:hypothetical protein
MSLRPLLLSVLFCGCASGEEPPSIPSTPIKDSGTAPRPDTTPVDSGPYMPFPDSESPPIEEDSAIAEDTTIVESDTGSVADTFVPTDSVIVTDGGTGKVLIYDDFPAIPSKAPAAATALGNTPITCDSINVLSKFAEGGFDVIVVEAPNAPLPAGLDARLIDWMRAGGRLIFSHWQLDLLPTLTTELGVSATKYATLRPVHKDATGVDLFTSPQTVPSPLTGTGTTFGVHGFTLTVTAPSTIAARADSTTGEGTVAITHGGKVIVNGFLLADFAATDGDTDGKPDVQELLENELSYVLKK